MFGFFKKKSKTENSMIAGIPVYTFTMKYPSDEPGIITCRDCVIQCFSYETARRDALIQAHEFAQENGIPYYRVEERDA